MHSQSLMEKIADFNAEYCLVSMALEDLESIFMQEDQEGRAFLIKAVRKELNRITDGLIELEMEAKNYVRTDPQ